LGFAVVVVFLGIAVGFIIGGGRNALHDSTEVDVVMQAGPLPGATTTTTTVVAATTSTVAADGTFITVIGDSYTAGTAQGGIGDANWVWLLDSSLQASGLDGVIRGAGLPKSGYVARGTEDQTFGEAVAQDVSDQTDLVVFFGSYDELLQDPGTVAPAARAAFIEAQTAAPDADLLVIGVPWPNASVPTQVDMLNGILRTAATDVGATFVDPAAEGWFADDGLIGADGAYPTDAGHERMAELIRPLILTAIG
jgi:hypothetical protein